MFGRVKATLLNRVANVLQFSLLPTTRKQFSRVSVLILFSGTTSFGAWINVKSDMELKFEQFQAAKYQGKYEKPRPAAPIRGGWY